MEGGSGDWHYLFTSCLELTVEVTIIILIRRTLLTKTITIMFTKTVMMNTLITMFILRLIFR